MRALVERPMRMRRTLANSAACVCAPNNNVSLLHFVFCFRLETLRRVSRKATQLFINTNSVFVAIVLQESVAQQQIRLLSRNEEKKFKLREEANGKTRKRRKFAQLSKRAASSFDCRQETCRHKQIGRQIKPESAKGSPLEKRSNSSWPAAAEVAESFR